MILILVGQTASGKTTVKNMLVEKYGFTPITTYTTRPKRENEEEGKDYMFVSDEEFNVLKRNYFFAETTEYNAAFGYCQYGSPKYQYRKAGKNIVVLNPDGARQIKKWLNNEKDLCFDPFVVCLNIDQEILVNRALKRGDKPEEINRRLITDIPKFIDLYDHGYVDLTISVEEKHTPNEICEEIMKRVPK